MNKDDLLTALLSGETKRSIANRIGVAESTIGYYIKRFGLKNHLDSHKKQQLLSAIDATNTMLAAAKYLGVPYRTFIEAAKRFGIYEPNQGRRGISRPSNGNGFPLQDILDGKHPQYQSNHLRRRLLQEGIFEHKCSCCKLTEWNGQPIPIELDHIDGNKHNHQQDNLRLLCPNCHAQTDTYKGKNMKLR